MDGKEELIRRDGQEEVLRRDDTDVEAHRFRGGIVPDDGPGSEGVAKRTLTATDEADVEGHGVRPRI